MNVSGDVDCFTGPDSQFAADIALINLNRERIENDALVLDDRVQIRGDIDPGGIDGDVDQPDLVAVQQQRAFRGRGAGRQPLDFSQLADALQCRQANVEDVPAILHLNIAGGRQFVEHRLEIERNVVAGSHVRERTYAGFERERLPVERQVALRMQYVGLIGACRQGVDDDNALLDPGAALADGDVLDFGGAQGDWPDSRSPRP